MYIYEIAQIVRQHTMPLFNRNNSALAKPRPLEAKI